MNSTFHMLEIQTHGSETAVKFYMLDIQVNRSDTTVKLLLLFFNHMEATLNSICATHKHMGVKPLQDVIGYTSKHEEVIPL